MGVDGGVVTPQRCMDARHWAPSRLQCAGVGVCGKGSHAFVSRSPPTNILPNSNAANPFHARGRHTPTYISIVGVLQHQPTMKHVHRIFHWIWSCVKADSSRPPSTEEINNKVDTQKLSKNTLSMSIHSNVIITGAGSYIQHGEILTMACRATKV